MTRRSSSIPVVSIAIRQEVRNVRAIGEDDADDDAEDEEPVECPICRHRACSAQECSRTMSEFRCCEKSVCCGCLARVLAPCQCKSTCRSILTTCCFCRKQTPLRDRLELFLATRPTCADCDATDAGGEDADAAGDELDDPMITQGEPVAEQMGGIMAGLYAAVRWFADTMRVYVRH